MSAPALRARQSAPSLLQFPCMCGLGRSAACMACFRWRQHYTEVIGRIAARKAVHARRAAR